MMEQPTRVVVIGGGYGGSMVVKGLAGTPGLSITLIEPKESFLHSVGMPRMLVDAKFAEHSLIRYDGILKGAKHLRQFVTGVDFAKNVAITDGGEVEYDYLVLATGSKYAEPFRSSLPAQSNLALLSQIGELRERLAAAKRVVVVGGGATGIETAAEIKTAFSDRDVVLYNSGARLMQRDPRVGHKDAQTLLEKLEKLGVKVSLGTRFNLEEAHESDVIVNATGGSPITGYLPPDVLDENGYVQVDEFLRLPQQSRVFAVGDIVSGTPNIVPQATMAHAPQVVKNIKALHKNKNARLKAVRDLPNMLSGVLVTLGRTDYVASTFVNKLAGGMKAKTMFLDMYRKQLNAQ